MKSIPTVDNSGFCQTCGAVQVLTTNDLPPIDLDIYFRPAPNEGNQYLTPTGDLYKRPGSP